MPRILHGTQQDTPDPNIAFRMIRPLGDNGPYVPNAAFNTNSIGLNTNQPASVMNRSPTNGFPAGSLSPQVANSTVRNYNGMVAPNNPFFPNGIRIPSPVNGVVYQQNGRSAPNRQNRSRTHRAIPHI